MRSVLYLPTTAMIVLFICCQQAHGIEIRVCSPSLAPGQGCVEAGFLSEKVWTQSFAAGVCAGYEMARQIAARKIADRQDVLNQVSTNDSNYRTSAVLHGIASTAATGELRVLSGGTVWLESADKVFECPSGRIIK